MPRPSSASASPASASGEGVGDGSLGPPPPLSPPLPLAAEEFLTWLSVERGRSANTLAAYRRDLRTYGAWLARRGDDMGTTAEDTVAAYVAALRASGRAPASVARAVVVVRSLHRFLADEGVAATDPAFDLAVPHVPQGLPKALSEGEVERLLGVVAGDDPPARRDRAILEVLYGTGMRISELVGLDLADVSLDDGVARVLGKGDKQRIVPLGRFAATALDQWLSPGGRGLLQARRRPPRGSNRGPSSPRAGRRGGRSDAEAVFLNARGGRLSRQGAWGIVGAHASRAGLRDRLTPHVLRHSCATHMLDHGADIRVVQELLGHASITTTQVYTKVTTERLRAAYDAAHPRATTSRA